MKTQRNLKEIAIKMASLIVCSCALINNVQSQYHVLSGTTTLSPLYYYSTNGDLGLGIPTPGAKLNIRSTFTTQPVFQVDGVVGTNTVGYIKNFYNDGTQTYCIYQNSYTSGMLNYFSDPVKIGHIII